MHGLIIRYNWLKEAVHSAEAIVSALGSRAFECVEPSSTIKQQALLYMSACNANICKWVNVVLQYTENE
jgi:hypothetical protein